MARTKSKSKSKTASKSKTVPKAKAKSEVKSKTASKSKSKSKTASKSKSSSSKRRSPKLDEYYLQTAVARRLFKGANDEMRIGKDALEVYKMAIEEYTYEIAEQSSQLLQLGKKKTLSEKEVKVSSKMCTKERIRPKEMTDEDKEAKLYIPPATLKRILKRGASTVELESGDTIRISQTAVDAAQGLVRRFAHELATNSGVIAEGARRKTVKIEDLTYALETLGRKMYV